MGLYTLPFAYIKKSGGSARSISSVFPSGCMEMSYLPDLRYSVPPEDAMFIASGREDLPVMELAGKSLAVADAPDEVRHRAAKILWPSRDGGVGEYLYSLLK